VSQACRPRWQPCKFVRPIALRKAKNALNSEPLIPLNFRDLGGAPATGGRVAFGRLFRTAHLSELSDASAAYLHATLGVQVYIDFRVDEDILRDGQPQALLARGVLWQRHPFDISDPTFRALATPGAADWRALYSRAFLRLRSELTGAIRLLAAAPAPVAFGCWAGKDRTGMVSALVLSVLGVSDEWIAADFAKTGPELLPAQDRFSFIWRDRPNAQAELIVAHLRTEPASIVGFLNDIRLEFGSVQRALSLSDSALAALSERYVEPG
jgi:protein-tyrosine phosphatase